MSWELTKVFFLRFKNILEIAPCWANELTFLNTRRWYTCKINFFWTIGKSCVLYKPNIRRCINCYLVKLLILHCKIPSWTNIQGSASKICHYIIWLLYNWKQCVAYTDRPNSSWHVNNSLKFFNPKLEQGKKENQMSW